MPDRSRNRDQNGISSSKSAPDDWRTTALLLAAVIAAVPLTAVAAARTAAPAAGIVGAAPVAPVIGIAHARPPSRRLSSMVISPR